MKPSTELFKLVKSLSKSEKRFFKLTSSLQSGDKNYLKIFDYIDKQEEYDEEKLKQDFDGETFINHLPSEKNHLYKLILKSLRSFYSEDSARSMLKQEIKNVEILFIKGLYKECEKFLQRAKKIAQENELFYDWIDLISWEKRLLEHAFEAGEFSADLDALVAEEEQVIAKLRNLAEYHMIYSKINLIFRSGGFTRSESEMRLVDDIADYHLIKGKNTAISSRASSICYYIKGLCAATNRNFEDSFTFFNKTREIIDRSSHLKIDLGRRYVSTLSHLCRCYIESKSFIEAKQLIAEIRALSSQKGYNTIDIQSRIYSNTYIHELMLLQAQGDFDGCIRVISEQDENENKYKDQISKEHEILITYYKALSYFGVADYRRALAQLNDVLNDNEQNLRQDLYTFSKIFNLVVHYELGNYDFIEYIAKSTNRYINKQDRNYETESVIIKYMKKISKSIVGPERREIFDALQKEIDTLLEDRYERALLEYFNLPAWIASQRNRTTFQEEVVRNCKA